MFKILLITGLLLTGCVKADDILTDRIPELEQRILSLEGYETYTNENYSISYPEGMNVYYDPGSNAMRWARNNKNIFVVWRNDLSIEKFSKKQSIIEHTNPDHIKNLPRTKVSDNEYVYMDDGKEVARKYVTHKEVNLGKYIGDYVVVTVGNWVCPVVYLDFCDHVYEFASNEMEGFDRFYGSFKPIKEPDCYNPPNL